MTDSPPEEKSLTSSRDEYLLCDQVSLLCLHAAKDPPATHAAKDPPATHAAKDPPATHAAKDPPATHVSLLTEQESPVAPANTAQNGYLMCEESPVPPPRTKRKKKYAKSSLENLSEVFIDGMLLSMTYHAWLCLSIHLALRVAMFGLYLSIHLALSMAILGW